MKVFFVKCAERIFRIGTYVPPHLRNRPGDRSDSYKGGDDYGE